jgi:hypothetical protein
MALSPLAKPISLLLFKTPKVSGDVALNPIAREGHCQQSHEHPCSNPVYSPVAFPCVVAEKPTFQESREAQ